MRNGFLSSHKETAESVFCIVACRKGRSISKCNISNFAPGTNHVACMKNHKGDVSASPLISEVESATANEQKFTGSYFLSRDNSRVLGGGYVFMEVVPFLPETLGLLILIVAICRVLFQPKTKSAAYVQSCAVAVSISDIKGLADTSPL